MKTLDQNKAILELAKLRESFRNLIESEYESNAKDCLTCDVQGSCCTDAHFVNVHISRLEGVAMSRALEELGSSIQERVIERISAEAANLGRDFEATYSCPLFEPGIGCLVHNTAKPLPCINHACYENESQLPPASLLDSYETKMSRLNDRVYHDNWQWLPIPIRLSRVPLN